MNPYLSDFTFRVARSKRDFVGALTLAHKEYFRKNYCTDDTESVRLTPFHLLPETIVFIALYKGKVVGTITLIPDSRMGMPIDKLFFEELKPYRKLSVPVCEASTFAVDSDFFVSGSSVFDHDRLSFVFTFYKITIFYAKYILGCEYLFAAINPRHNVMHDFITFTDVCKEVKSYSFVNDAPAKAKVLHLTKIAKNCRERNLSGLHKMLLENHVSLENYMYKYALEEEDVEYLLNKCPSFLDNHPEALEILEEYYPELVLV